MIVTLCGSARFEPWFHLYNEVLTLSGHTVFGLAVYPSTKAGQKNWYSENEKRLLDEAHLRKIDASDAVLVLNPFAYLGESTLREIDYARQRGKKLYILESWGEGLGISKMHFESVRRAAANAWVPEGFGSPIDTFYPHFNGVHNLYFPEAGAFRTGLVERVNEFKRKYEGSHE